MRIDRSLVAAFTLLLAACATEYTYEPPTTSEGKFCVAKCQGRQGNCHESEQVRARDEQQRCQREGERKQAQCDHDSQIEYDACLKYSKTDADRNKCKKNSCDAPGCYSSANYGQCDSDYRACFQSCGGKVGILK